MCAALFFTRGLRAAVVGALIAVVLSSAWAAPYTGLGPGSSTIGPGGDYANLRAASLAINAAPLTGGDWTFLITADLTVVNNIAIGQNTNGNKIIFRPAPGVSPTIAFTKSDERNSNFFGHWVIGTNQLTETTYASVKTDNIIIDGCNTPGGTTRNLTIQNTDEGAGTDYLLAVYGDSDNAAIRNCIIKQVSLNASRHAIRVTSINIGGGDLHPDGFVAENNRIEATSTSSAACISFENITGTGPLVATTSDAVGWTVRGNELLANSTGVLVFIAGAMTIERNRIVIDQAAPSTDGRGVMILGTRTTGWETRIERNVFEVSSKTNNDSRGCYALWLEAGPPTNAANRVAFRVVNNMISCRLTATEGQPRVGRFFGIWLRSAFVDLRAYHNSIYLLKGAVPYTCSFDRWWSAGGVAAISVWRDDYAGSADIRNNLIKVSTAMVTTGGNLPAVGLDYELQANATGTVISNYNTVFVENGAQFGRRGVGTIGGPADPNEYQNYATLAAWTAGTGFDTAGGQLDPCVPHPPATGAWVSETNLHWSAPPGSAPDWYALPVGNVTVDLDGDARSQTAPWRGADEIPSAVTPTPTCAADVDKDGVCDPEEGSNSALPAGKSNIWVYDSDGDGLRDGAEDANRNGLRDNGETSTRNRDSDGDQFRDGIERMLGLDPLAANSGYSDADSDGLPNSADPCPNARDCDGDRYGDGYEAGWFQDAAAANDAGRKPPLGDADGANGLSNLDALVTQSLFLGNILPSAPFFRPDTYAGFRYLDANLDGSISNVDALIIQSFFLGNVQAIPLQY